MPLCCFLKRTGVGANSGSVSPSCLPCARVSSREKASGSINMECAASGTGLSRSMVQLNRVPPFNFRSVVYTCFPHHLPCLGVPDELSHIQRHGNNLGHTVRAFWMLSAAFPVQLNRVHIAPLSWSTASCWPQGHSLWTSRSFSVDCPFPNGALSFLLLNTLICGCCRKQS